MVGFAAFGPVPVLGLRVQCLRVGVYGVGFRV